MSAVLKESPSNITALFERLAAKAPELAETTAEQRVEKIRKLLKAILDARPAILAAGKKELRLVDLDIDAQLLMVKSEADFVMKHLAGWMQPQVVDGTLMSLGKKCYVHYEPKGVVLHVSTWNAPIAEAFVPAIGAIAAGNSFCLKPSELAPLSAQVLADIAGAVFPDDEFAVVNGGADVAQELLRQPFNHIFYIGGHAVGRLIMKAAAEHFATVTLEMGGKNPTIVDASADIDDAAKKTAWGRVCNAGQVCLAPDYALVHESVMRSFIDALGKHMSKMYGGEGGYQKSEYLPRIVNARHFQRIKGLLDDAIAKGAKVEHGGQSDEADLFIAPTILSNVKPEMRIMQEEIFGPIICVMPFGKREDVVKEIKKRPKPLGSYIFAKDRAAIDWFLKHTTSGSSSINHNLIQAGINPSLPFGGANASGIGRLGGRYTFLECSNARAVVEDGGVPGVDPDMMFPPYSKKYADNIAFMLNKGLNLPGWLLNGLNKVLRKAPDA